MKKMKKFFAVILSLAMVLGMSMTAFAANPTQVNIKLNNLDKAKEVKYMQIIEPNQTTKTGWTFINGAGDAYGKAFVTDYDSKSDDEKLAEQQTIIWKLIFAKEKEANADLTAAQFKQNHPAAPADLVAASSEEIATALNNVKGLTTGWTDVTGQTVISVSKAGLYAIKAEEDGYTYTVMSGYVGFGAVDGQTYPALQGTEVSAKRTEDKIEKKTTDADHAVHVGEIIEYTIETEVPYIDPAKTTGRTFTISDILEGADYVFAGTDGEWKVEVNGQDVTSHYVAPKPTTENGKNTFILIMNDLVASTANPNMGQKVKITYKAKVTALTAKNTPYKNVDGTSTSGDNVNVYTGQITFTKVDAKDNSKKLKGAQFTLAKKNNNGTYGDALTFTKQTDGSYIYDEKSNKTVLESDANGKVIVKGLGIGTYKFTETKAPEGYSINTDIAEVTLSVDGVAKEIFSNGTDMKVLDTTLSSLPSTGGIGTTIFTIAGCAIMIAAAGFFFASRKKANR